MAETQDGKILSPALKANLELTRHEVTIPDEYAPLLATVEQYHGVRTKVERLLKEYFHPMRNLEMVATSLQNICGGRMFHYYENSPERGRCATLFVTLFEGLYDSETGGETLGKAFRANLDFFEVLRQSLHSAEYAESTGRILDVLLSVFGKSPALYLPYSNFVRNVARRVKEPLELAAKLARLYKAFVVEGLKVFKENVDFAGWFRKSKPELGRQYASTIAKLQEGSISDALKRLEESEDPGLIFSQPNIDDLLNYTIEQVNGIESPIHRIEFYVYLASKEELRYRDMDILRGLHNSLQSACEICSEEDIVQAIDLVAERLREGTPDQKHSLFKCLEKLGKEVAKKDAKLVEYFVQKVIDTGFESPRITGVSEEWQVRLNPNHLECVRTWLNIIKEDPRKYESLLSALIINLYFRKIFVSDTDLFQRDVTALLNSGIAGSFNLTMQLVAFFPVFFNEIGSEGVLREVSTKVDQIVHRQDPIVHFLRKQSHAESNNRLVGFARGILQYWRDGDREHLRRYLPEPLFESVGEDNDLYRHSNSIMKHVEDKYSLKLDDLEIIDYEALKQALGSAQDASGDDRERVFLMVKFYRLLKEKYAYSPDQLMPLLSKSNLVGSDAKRDFARACESGDSWRILCEGNKLLLELKDNITDSAVTKPDESIYLKRHIAAGIPSMYGTYREKKFDSMGMLIRVVTFLKKHLENTVARFNFRYITRSSMREAHEIMQQMLLGLRVYGLPVEDLSTKVELLKKSISAGNFSASQYLNIFEFIAGAVNDIVESNYIAVHNVNLKTVTRQILEEKGLPAEQIDEKAHEISEEFLRSIISSTYAIQEFDLFLGNILQSLRSMTKTLDDRSCSIILNYSPEKLVSQMGEPLGEREDQLSLGYKGYALKKLKALSLPIPEGFIVSTELFDILPAMSYEDLRHDTRERILPAVHRLEEETGRELGNPDRPLLLSVRSGAAFSMPGMMDTILNVGMNDKLTEELSKKPNYGWTSWDCYRRFLQSFAMSCGVSRDVFDDIMIRHKDKYNVTRKLQFSPAQMREMAYEYKSTAAEHGVTFIEDPFDQLMKAIFLVIGSWDSDPARVYRKQMQLSDDWGTGVIVQRMILGNVNYDSGTGVVFTKDPRAFSTAVNLFGDFVMCSQGEDVVAGLVNPYPISEKQRKAYFPKLNISLEKIYPEIYSKLREIAVTLINGYGYEHQELEFTFETSKPQDLFILQTKPLSTSRDDAIPVFVSPEEVQKNLLGTGVGVSGGAMSGAVAFTEEGIRDLRASRPGENIILLRPDTVPEDIALVLAVDGLLTARGGATSHASVTAKRIGRTCVVNCADLFVSETKRFARIGMHELRPGDLISIDGHSGHVCAGKLEIKELRQGIIPF